MTKTVCIFCSTFNPENRFLDEVTHLSELFSEKKINKVYFDRGGYKYHGRIKALAESLRKNGLNF